MLQHVTHVPTLVQTVDCSADFVTVDFWADCSDVAEAHASVVVQVVAWATAVVQQMLVELLHATADVLQHVPLQRVPLQLAVLPEDASKPCLLTKFN